MQTRNTIIEQLMFFRGQIIHIFANSTGRAEPQAEMIMIIGIAYIICNIVMISFHSKLVKRHKRIYQNLVTSYDTIRYQVAKAQYNNPNFKISKGIQVVMEAEQKKYTENIDTIRQEIDTMGQGSGDSIVSEDQRKNITKQIKKKKKIGTFVQIIGRLITTITIGIYKLFR